MAGLSSAAIPAHRRALLRNLVTSIILNDRVHTTITKAKATRPIVEKMITLGKNGSVHARRQALAYLMTPESVDRLFATVAPRYATRTGGYSAHRRAPAPARAMPPKMAFIELLGAEQELNEKAQKREEAAPERREELQKQLEERGPGDSLTHRSSRRLYSQTQKGCRAGRRAFLLPQINL